MVFLYDDGPQRTRIGKKEKDALYKDQKGRCNYCGIKLGLVYMHIDHKTPSAMGGSDRLNNLQIQCGPCNTRKGATTDGEFRRKYKLTPSRQAKGPPSKQIAQSHFEGITKTVAQTRAKRRRSEDEGFGFF